MKIKNIGKRNMRLFFITSCLILLFVLVNIAFCGSVQNKYHQRVEVDRNNFYSLGDYSLVYRTYYSHNSFKESFEVKDKKNRIIHNNKDLFLGLKKRFVVDDNFTYTLEELNSKSIVINIFSDLPFFSQLNLTTNMPSEVNVKLGEDVNIPLTINNSGLLDEVVNLKLKKSDCYDYSFFKDGFDVSRIMVEKGSIESVELKIITSKSCDSNQLNLEPTISTFKNSSLDLILKLDGEAYKRVFVDGSSNNFNIGEGESFEITMKIENVYDVDKTFKISLDATGSFSAKSYIDKLLITEIKVPSKSVRDFKLLVNAPSTEILPDSKIVVNVTDGVDDYESLELKLSSKSKTDKMVTQLSKLFLTTKADSQFDFDVKINNMGTSDITNSKLEVVLPNDNWRYEVSEKIIDKIKKKEFKTVQVRVFVPKGVDVGDYFINLNGISDQTKSPSVKLRVNIESENSFLWFGVLIVVLMIIGLFYVFKKFGRK